MKNIILILLVTLSPLFSAEDTRMAKAKELMELLELKKNIAASTAQIMQSMDGFVDAQGLTPEQAKNAKELSRAAMQSSFKAMEDIDWDTMFSEVYADVFSVEELQGLVDFYKSPVGKKFLSKQPELTGATMQRMQKEMMKIMPKVQADVQKAIEEAQSK